MNQIKEIRQNIPIRSQRRHDLYEQSKLIDLKILNDCPES